MLVPRTLSDLTFRNAITAVSEAGLVLSVTGVEHHASWAAVNSVGVGVAPHGDAEIFVIALCIDDGEATRLLIVAEIEKIWSELTAILPTGLPGVEPFERWGAALAEKPDVVMLYERRAP